MADEDIKNTFLKAANEWICDGYSADLRFVAAPGDVDHNIWAASISLNPLPPKQDLSFYTETENIVIGQRQKNLLKKNELLSTLVSAASGVVELDSKSLQLISDGPYYYHSEMSNRDRWFYQMHLQIDGAVRPRVTLEQLAVIDNQLRTSALPFDGLVDASAWLDLGEVGTESRPTGIQIRINPPVDLIYEHCRLVDDKLTLTLHAHPEFECHQVGLAVRAAPGEGLDSRRQVGGSIVWGGAKDGRREGVAEIDLKNADAVLVLLMLGQSPVRRQWFSDSRKARNNRLLTVQHFDDNLRMIRKGVLESGDQNKFELGVASLAFLLGFSPSIQSETDSPDIVLATPGGRLALVESLRDLFPAPWGVMYSGERVHSQEPQCYGVVVPHGVSSEVPARSV